jgi:nucleoside-diphosphate-sugar epimerase
MKILITGSNGYIGAKVVENFFTDSEFEIINTSSKKSNDNKYLYFDILSDDSKEFIKKYEPEILLHIAWFAEHGKFWTSELNITWMHKSIELIQNFYAFGGRKVVVIGTCAEYDSSYGYCIESKTPSNPTSLYGICKNTVFKIANLIASRENKDLTWIRIFHLYGGAENPNRLVPYIIKKLMSNEIAYCSEGSQIRDFLHIDDISNAIYNITKSNITGVINIGSGIPIQLRELILSIQSILGKKNMIHFEKTLSANEPKILIPDISRLKNETLWNPKFSLKDGLENTIQYWSKR